MCMHAQAQIHAYAQAWAHTHTHTHTHTRTHTHTHTHTMCAKHRHKHMHTHTHRHTCTHTTTPHVPNTGTNTYTHTPGVHACKYRYMHTGCTDWNTIFVFLLILTHDVLYINSALPVIQWALNGKQINWRQMLQRLYTQCSKMKESKGGALSSDLVITPQCIRLLSSFIM